MGRVTTKEINAIFAPINEALKLDGQDQIKVLAEYLSGLSAYQFTEIVLPNLETPLPKGLAAYVSKNCTPPEGQKCDHAVLFKGKGKSRAEITSLLGQQLAVLEAVQPKQPKQAEPSEEIQAILNRTGQSYQKFLEAAVSTYAKRFSTGESRADQIQEQLADQIPGILAAIQSFNEANSDDPICPTNNLIAQLTGYRPNDVGKAAKKFGATIGKLREDFGVSHTANRNRDVVKLLNL